MINTGGQIVHLVRSARSNPAQLLLHHLKVDKAIMIAKNCFCSQLVRYCGPPIMGPPYMKGITSQCLLNTHTSVWMEQKHFQLPNIVPLY